VAEQVPVGGLGPRRYVEHLEGAGAGQVAAGHVADRVAARLPGGEPDLGHLPHEGGDPGEGDEVELKVLAGGDVAPAPGVPDGQVRQLLELFGPE
jgi:hypothetical protein